MQHILKNGSFVQRRKMFVEAPFHNLSSLGSKANLDWTTIDQTTNQMISHKNKLAKDKQKIREAYNSNIQKSLQRKYNFTNMDGNNKYQQTKYQSPLLMQDTLMKQIQAFNSSKTIDNQNNTKNEIDIRASSRRQQIYKNLPQQKRPTSNNKIEKDLKIKQNLHDYNNVNISNRENTKYSRNSQQKNNRISPQRIYEQRQFKNISKLESYSTPQFIHNYNPVQKSRTIQSPRLLNPYLPYKDFGRAVQELYTGAAPREYPFRNIHPDKLQNHLRPKLKADHKHKFDVSLNLFHY